MLYKAFISYSHAADGKLAPTLQKALQRFAKPWYRIRAFRVFRDTTNLSAAPELWPEIEKALGESEYLLFLASPEAAGSKWVRKEQAYWRQKKDTSKLLIVLTSGDIVWDDANGDFDWGRTSALPDVLREAFKQEPLYLDFRRMQSAQLSLGDENFLDYIATIAAPLHGKSKDEIFGEHIRQHRRTMQLTWSAVVALTILLLTAVAAAAVAFQQYRIAENRRVTATAQNLAARAELARGQTGQLRRSILLALDSWDCMANGEAILTLRHSLDVLPQQLLCVQHGKGVEGVAFSPDGACLATADDDGVYVWRCSDGAPLVSLSQPSVRQLSFNGDGTQLTAASGRTVGGQRFAKLWDWRTSGVVRQAELPQLEGALLVSASGRFVAAGEGPSWYTRLWDSHGGASPQRLSTRKSGDALAFSEDERYLVVAASEGEIDVWNLNDLRKVAARFTLDDHPTAVAISDDGRTVAAAGRVRGIKTQTNKVRIWRFPPPDAIDRDTPDFSLIIDAGSGATMAFSPDSRYMAVGGGQTTRLVRSEDGQEVFAIRMDEGARSLAFSPGGHYLAGPCFDNSVRVWEVETGREVARIEHERPITAIAFEAKDGLLATASEDGTARIWDCSKALRSDLPFCHGTPGQVASISTPRTIGRFDGNRADTIASDTSSRRSHPAEGSTMQGSPVTGVPDTALDWPIPAGSDSTGEVISSDRRFRAAIGSEPAERHIVRVWEGSSRKPARELEHPVRVRELFFCPAEPYLLTVAVDNVVRVWDLCKGFVIAEVVHPLPFVGHFGQPPPTVSACFRHDGSRLITAASYVSDMLHAWIWRPKDVCAKARARLGTSSQNQSSRGGNPVSCSP
jgi:WD40 repeat protein